MRRAQRLANRQANATATRIANRKVKVQERKRRDGRMIERIKKGGLPYTPDVMSWLSVKLGKKSSRITDADLKTLLV